MKYHCGHEGCDVCGARECKDVILNRYYGYIICEYCHIKALRLIVHMAEELGGIFIDPSKPCGREKVYNEGVK